MGDDEIYNVSSDSGSYDPTSGSSTDDEGNPSTSAWGAFGVDDQFRPVAPNSERDFENLRETVYTETPDCTDTIETDILLTFIYLKLRTCVRHFSLLYLMSIERLWKIGLSQSDKRILKNTCLNDSEVVREFVSDLDSSPCDRICKKAACVCDSWYEHADQSNIISLAKALINKCWNIEQFLNIKASNIKHNNEFLATHPQQNHLYRKRFDKVDYEISIWESGRVGFALPDRFTQAARWRAARRAARHRPANHRRKDCKTNYTTIYQHLCCAIFKLAYITAYFHLGCFTPIVKPNEHNSAPYYSQYLKYAAQDADNYFKDFLGTFGPKYWYRALSLAPQICCCQATISQIICLSESCCRTRPYCVTRPDSTFSIFHINYGLFHGKLPNERAEALGTMAAVKPKIKAEVKNQFYNFLLNRHNFNTKDENIHAQMFPFVCTTEHEMRFRLDHSSYDRPLTEHQRSRLKATFMNKYCHSFCLQCRDDPEHCLKDPIGYQFPLTTLDKFYNMVYFTNPGNIILLYQKTLEELQPFNKRIRLFEQQEAAFALSQIRDWSSEKFRRLEMTEHNPWSGTIDGNVVLHPLLHRSDSDSSVSDFDNFIFAM